MISAETSSRAGLDGRASEAAAAFKGRCKQRPGGRSGEIAHAGLSSQAMKASAFSA